MISVNRRLINIVDDVIIHLDMQIDKYLLDIINSFRLQTFHKMKLDQFSLLYSLVGLRLNIEQVFPINRVQIIILFEIAKILLSNVASHELFVILVRIFYFPGVNIIYRGTLSWRREIYTFLNLLLLLVIWLLTWFLVDSVDYFGWSVRWVVLVLLVPACHTSLILHFSLLKELFFAANWWTIGVILVDGAIFHLDVLLLRFNIN